MTMGRQKNKKCSNVVRTIKNAVFRKNPQRFGTVRGHYTLT